ncbi:MAG: hypothetical protein F4Y69_10145 [Chloroflexi bacterium]|nr:hypothetical protein [Chloroflexota bacterium]MXX81376.1 hypothetical protein [Chloroflexota bacterium]MYD17720.1 hypothetical protein [Chloroflexota bacterium]MYF22756.1 hypothetical protein [Chloroflexota bacterium]MYJ02274.1 hypothetical protein [Chloroflexota bacterium]
MRSTLGTLRSVIAGRRPAGREVGSARAETWVLRLLAALAAVGLLVALGSGAAVLAHPPLFAELRPWWPPLAAVGLLSTAAGYWLLWGRGR